MLLNRNDKCYCGSGKKYKNCCMDKDIEKERMDRKIKLVEEAQAKYAEIYLKMVDFAKEEKFAEYRKSAEEIFYILNADSVKAKFEKFFNTYFISDCLLEGRKTLAQIYAEEKKPTDKELRIMNSLINSYVSIYTIEKKDNDKAVLKDCLLNETVNTDDVKLLKDFNEGDSIIARIVEVNGLRILIDITVKITESTKDFMVEDMDKLYEQNKEEWISKKIFLAYNTYIFYKYLQQLLDEEVSNYVRETLLAKDGSEKSEEDTKNEDIENNENVNKDEENNSEIEEKDNVKLCKKAEKKSENNESVESLLCNLADEDCKDKCISFWKEYETNHKDIKGSEIGWAAAVEYLVKKENKISATQAQIAKKYGTSSSTIGKRAKELKAE